MLSAAHRLTTADQFRRTVRTGRRSGSATLVVHVVEADNSSASRAGFVVSKAVGSAVVRNRVKRRLRHIVAAELSEHPRGAEIVVRALPPAAEASFEELRAAVRKGLRS